MLLFESDSSLIVSLIGLDDSFNKDISLLLSCCLSCSSLGNSSISKISSLFDSFIFTLFKPDSSFGLDSSFLYDSSFDVLKFSISNSSLFTSSPILMGVFSSFSKSSRS